MLRVPPLRTLLWVDCIAGAVNGMAVLALSPWIAPFVGFPLALVIGTALVNLAYGSFSFSLARQAHPPRTLIRALIIANFAWLPICLVLAALHAGPGSWLGVAWIVGEGLLVAVLAGVEARSLRAEEEASESAA